MNHVGLNDKVVSDKFGWIGIVGMNATYLGRSKKDLLRLLCIKK